MKSPGTGSPSGFQPSSSPPGLRPGVFARRRWRPFGQVLEPCRTHELDFSDGTPSRGGSSLFPYQISAESLDQDANRIVRLHIYSRPGLETKSCDCDTSLAKSLSAPIKVFISSHPTTRFFSLRVLLSYKSGFIWLTPFPFLGLVAPPPFP